MVLREVCDKIGLKVLAGEGGLDKEITGVYISDLLSWVMSHAKKGEAWVTVQTHANVVAVATLLELGCVIVPEDIEVEEDTLAKANDEEMPMLSSSMNSFQLAKAFIDLGIGA